MSDQRITESKPTLDSARRPSAPAWLKSAVVSGLVLCAAVACRNEPTQTTEPLQPGAAGTSGAEGEGTRGMGTTGSGTRTSGNDGTQQGTPMSGSGSGQPGASANDRQPTSGDDTSERTGSGGTSGKQGTGSGGTAGTSAR